MGCAGLTGRRGSRQVGKQAGPQGRGWLGGLGLTPGPSCTGWSSCSRRRGLGSPWGGPPGLLPRGSCSLSLTPHPHPTPAPSLTPLHPCTLPDPAPPLRPLTREVPLPGALHRVHQQQPHRGHQDHRQRLRPRGKSSRALVGALGGVGLSPRRSRAKNHRSSKGWWPAYGLQAWTRQLYPLSGS